ncbi:MAG: HDOD domain-containing protein [Phycisphaeraceae bacterium]|nr:HDOD domain-containing protein [Phycisphaeraceae bacterium]
MTADSQDQQRTGHIELILRQVEALPTLPAVAMRILSLTSNDQTHVQEVVDLITTDPALTVKVLSLCRGADLGIRHEVMTVDRAVTMLGFNAIRNAVLSMKVFDTFQNSSTSSSSEPLKTQSRFDRSGFWRHSVAVAVAAENIARAHPQLKDITPSDAFVCGLLHDMGKLALDMLLPKSYDRVIELTELNQSNIAELERRIVGIDHHTAGKRLAEQWRLPHKLQDCIWLHGADPSTLPQLEHRRLIGLINLADLIVRRQHLGFSGNFNVKESPTRLATELGFNPEIVSQIEKTLLEEVEKRSAILGLGDVPTRELYHESIQRANEELGRLNNALERRSRTAGTQSKILGAIAQFHAQAVPGRNLQDIVSAVVRSALSVVDKGFMTMIWQPQSTDIERKWMVVQFGDNARLIHCELIDPPPHSPNLNELDASGPAAMNMVSMIPWVVDYLIEAPDVRKIQMLPLSCGWGTSAILLHDRQSLPPWQHLAALTNTWGAAIASVSQHEGARRLGEDLAQANLALADAHDRLLRNESMARLGEMAAGAAHEMNNPLAVICGRSQLLARDLPADSPQHKHAKTIVDQSHRLSNLITALKLFTEPAEPHKQEADMVELLDGAIDDVKLKLDQIADQIQVDVIMPELLPKMSVDSQQIRQAVSELILNAVEADTQHHVSVHAALSANARDLHIQVSDKGSGMDAHTLAHAMDPFFSAKPAGRQIGMGLTRARQLVAAHGGEVGLCSEENKGTQVTLSLPLDSDSF